MESKGCLICSSTGTHSFAKTRIVDVAMKKILKYLRIPQESSQELLALSLSYCESCFSIVNDVVEMCMKIEALEIQIQWTAHTIGSKVMRSPVSNKVGPTGINPKNFAMLWERFKKPVIQNYVSKKLPDPCVRISYADKSVVDIKKEPMEVDNKRKLETASTSAPGPAPKSKPAAKAVPERVVVKKGIKKVVPRVTTKMQTKLNSSVPENIRKMTKQITCGVKIGPKSYLKRIGRGGPNQKGVQQTSPTKAAVKRTNASANKKSEIKIEPKPKVRVGPKSYLKKIGRFDGPEEHVKSGVVSQPVQGSQARKIVIKPISLTTSSSSQQPKKVKSSLGSELFEKVTELKLTQAHLEALDEDSSDSENYDSEASTDPFEEYVQDKIAVRKSKLIRRWLESIEDPVASDAEDELLDILLIAVVLTENCTQDKTGSIACTHCTDFKISDACAFNRNLLLDVVTHVAETHYFLSEDVETTSSDSETKTVVSSTSRDSMHQAQLGNGETNNPENAGFVSKQANMVRCPVCDECIGANAKAAKTASRDLKRRLFCHYFKFHISVPIKPRFSLRHQKTGYCCDRCDFFSEVSNLMSTSGVSTNKYDSQRAWSARRVLVKHHVEFHLDNGNADELVEPQDEFNMETSFKLTNIDINAPFDNQPDQEDMQDDEYETDGDILALLEPEVILSYSSHDEASIHDADEIEHEEKKDIEDKEQVKYETEDKFVCPECTFTTPKRNLDRQSALNKLLSHYRKEHLPVRSNERLKNANGEDYYECVNCDFKALVEYSASSVGVVGPQLRYETRLKLAWHYLSEHSPQQPISSNENTPLVVDLQHAQNMYVETSKVDTEEKNSSPPAVTSSRIGSRNSVKSRSPSIENDDSDEVFKCPICDFLSPSDVCVAESIKIRLYRARQKIFTHYALTHLEEIVLVKKDTGAEGYQCTSCDYFAKLGSYKSGYHAKYFAKSSLAKHILEDHDGKRADPVELVEVNLSESDNKTETENEVDTDNKPDLKTIELNHPKHNPCNSEVEVIEIDSSSDDDQAVLGTKPEDKPDMDCLSDFDVPVIKNVFSQFQSPN